MANESTKDIRYRGGEIHHDGRICTEICMKLVEKIEMLGKWIGLCELEGVRPEHSYLNACSAIKYA